MSNKELPPEKIQVDRFKEAACALGCNGDEAAFDENLAKIAKKKPDSAVVKSSNKKR